MKLRELGIGSVVLEPESGLFFLVAAQNHPGYGGTTLLARHIVELGCMDGAEPDVPNHPVFEQQSLYGSNDYGQSNLHQWLNADGILLTCRRRSPTCGTVRYPTPGGKVF